jgi:hypothetical protein
MAEVARRGTAVLDAELALERRALEGRCAPYARALAILPRVLSGPAGRFLGAAWEHRAFFAPYDRPLLLLAALRHEALLDGPGHPLWDGFAAPEPSAAAVTRERLAAALDGRRDRLWAELARRGLKTNETSRAVAWLWPAALAGGSHGGRPIALCDVGASAGLNLVADALPSIWTDPRGAPLEVVEAPAIVSRLGLDPEPLDAARDDDVRWLRACIWPGERDREARLDQAVQAFRATRIRPDAPVLAPVSARDVPTRLDLLSAADGGALVLAYQTVVRDFLAPAERAEYEAGMRGWVGAHPPGQALWMELEVVTGTEPVAGALVAHVRAPSGEARSVELARCDVHPRLVDPSPEGVAEVRALLAPSERAEARP